MTYRALLLLFCSILLCAGRPAQAQTPKGFNYQAIARDAQGDPLSNTPVTVRFQIRQNSAVGPIVYDESHATSTDERGLFTLVIGDGSPLSGVFNNIDWAAADHYLGVLLNGTLIGTEEFQAVPYAKWARNGSKWLENGSSLYYDLGDVAVGTDLPAARLHVRQSGTSISDGFRLETSLATNEDWYYYMDGNDDLRIRNDAFEFFAIQKNTGNVGIGIFDFVPKLAINGKTRITNGEEASLTTDGHLQLGSSTGLNLVIDDNEITARNNGLESTLFLQPNQGQVSVGTTTSLDAALGVDNTIGASYIVRFRQAGTSKFGVHSNGGTSVGSLTVPPLNGLYVSGNVRIGSAVEATGYKVSIDGKVMCEELRVQNSTAWPDYVFTKEHERPDLAELEARIQELGHLPGVPSASEVDENGVLVGDMQRILLEKVEELTLYLIETEKRVQALEAENAELKKTSKR